MVVASTILGHCHAIAYNHRDPIKSFQDDDDDDDNHHHRIRIKASAHILSKKKKTCIWTKGSAIAIHLSLNKIIHALVTHL